MTWQPLERSVPHRDGVPIDIGDEEQWMNHLYVVHLRHVAIADDADESTPELIHLSIRNQDRSTKHDWRDFQRIKNQLAGPDWEAIEIYPAESRLVDMANQYHLWCLSKPIGIGFSRRLVANATQSAMLSPGSTQRDPEAVDLRYGGLSKIKEMREAEAEFEYGQPLKPEEAP